MQIPKIVNSPSSQPGGGAMDLLVEAGAVLSSSLDPTTTMGQVAQLTVPRLADLCVIDLLDDDGSIRDVAAAAVQAGIPAELERLRRRYPLDPDGEHPVAKVIRDGRHALLPEMTNGLLRSFAEGSEHARFMIEHDYRSAVVAPLLARGRTLGALSVLRFGNGERYGPTDAELVCELARRSALAIDNARLFSELQSVERRLGAILVNLAEAITMIDRQGQTVFANQAAADLLGVATPEELVSEPPGKIMERFLVLDEHGRELDLQSMPARRLLIGQRSRPLLVRNIVRATGEERWLVVRSSPVCNPDSGAVEYVVNVFENITEVKRTQLNESFMAEASSVLASSMDYSETLGRVAQLAVPQLADWCGIDILDEHGEIKRVAVHHADPDKVALAHRLDLAYRRTLDEPAGVAEVIRSGRAQIHTDIAADALAVYARDHEHLELLQAIGARAVIIAPMFGPSKPIGAITLVSSDSLRRFSEIDLALSERLARRAGTAVENARLYTERSRIAHTLQRALLPDSLPDIPGAEVCARYRAAGELNEVGGDFYDVFHYQQGRWMLVIGDVCGKGPHAAAVTALARHTLRAAAHSGQSHTEMLGMLHRALLAQSVQSDLCTVCLVTLTLGCDGAQLQVSLAGHPPPLVIGTGGEVRQIGLSGTLLGALETIEVNESEHRLGAGETLLMYTDGVPEAGRADRRLGEQGLMALCQDDAARLQLRELLERIEEASVRQSGGSLRDDLALLALRLASESPSGKI